MKSGQTRITDLIADVLTHIMFLAVTPAGGAITFARIRCICKDFKECADADHLLRNANFWNLKLPIGRGSFWMPHGLLTRCACAGNLTVPVPLSRNLLDRARSVLSLNNAAREASMHVNVITSGRYHTRSKSRASGPFTEWLMAIVVRIRTEHGELVGILEMLVGIMFALHLRRAAAQDPWLRVLFAVVILSMGILEPTASSTIEILGELKAEYDMFYNTHRREVLPDEI